MDFFNEGCFKQFSQIVEQLLQLTINYQCFSATTEIHTHMINQQLIKKSLLNSVLVPFSKYCKKILKYPKEFCGNSKNSHSKINLIFKTD